MEYSRPDTLWSRLRWPLTLLIFAATLVYSIYQYPALPDVMPTHFGANGMPNGWSSKNLGAFLGVIGQVVMIPIYAGIFFLSRDPKKAVSSRWKGHSNLTPEQFLSLRPLMDLLVDGVMVPMILLFAHLQVLTDQMALGQRHTMGDSPFVYVVFIVGWSVLLSIILTVKSIGLKRQGR